MSLADLTELTSRLIAQSGTVRQEEDEPPSDGPPIAETGGPQIDEDDTTPKPPPEFRGFRRTDALEFQRVVNWIIDHSFGGELPTNMSSTIDAWVEDWAERWRVQEGLSGSAQPQTVPTLEMLIQDQGFLSGALWLPFMARTPVPPFFTSEKTNADGETVPALGVADPLSGITFYDFGELELLADSPVRTRLAFTLLAANPTDPRVAQFLSDRDHKILSDTLALEDKFSVGRTDADRRPLPHLSLEDLAALAPAPQTTGTGRSIAFDRDHLMERAAETWRRWYLTQPEQPILEGSVDAYIREARAFWNQGGQLDFDTFIKNKLRSQPRYSVMFRHMPEGMDEDQFIDSFRPIGQLGLRPATTLAETSAAIRSGSGPAEQVKRVSRTREFQNLGGFSRRLAATISGLGAGARV